ncbi:MAG: DUF3822 family protein [Bacteroidota bacterium]|nr:DUF3822 family protein [Bacteroidota bacterium]
MKPVFEILPDTVDAEKSILVCEISNQGFSYAIKNEEQNMYVGVAVFHFNKNTVGQNDANILQEIISQQSLLSQKFKKVCISFSYGESVLVPFELYNSAESDNVLNLIHGDIQNKAIVLTDLVTEKKVYNAYRVPADIIKILTKRFPNAINRHQYSALLKQTSETGNKLLVIFYPQKIVVRLIKNGNVEFINNFDYRAAEDVSYILLNVCKQFEVANVPLEVSGLIDKDSGLYKEIYKYFESVQFATLSPESNYVEAINQHPAHYFSHIFAFDTCE